MSTATEQQVISAQSNPELAAALAARATSGGESSRPEEPRAALPPETDVDLPGGFADLLAGDVIRHAQVRELNGLDEEALAKAGSSYARFIDTVLQRGVVSVAGRKPAEVLDMLLSGDRDFLVLAIRNVTYGDMLSVPGVVCTVCRAEQTVEIDMTTQVPTRRLEGDRRFTVQTRRGEAVVTLPTGATQRELLQAQADGKTGAEMNTILLAATVESVGGQAVLGAAHVREGLGARDRQDILEQISARVPGPRLGEVSTPCRSCGESIALPLTLADMFRF